MAGYGVYAIDRRSAFRPHWIFLLLVAACLGSGWLAWAGPWPRAGVFFFVVAGWLVSLSLHEYAHALLGYRHGDHSVAARGYLRLNLLKYAHPVLSIVLPVAFLLLGGIGLPGGAVWIDRSAIRGRWANSLISLAGPLVNLGLGIALTVPFWFGVDFLAHLYFWSAVAFLAFLQYMATALNLLPIPGLDGGNAVRPWLTTPWDRRFDLVAPWGMLILFVIIFQGPGSVIFFEITRSVVNLFGLPTALASTGQYLFQFWR